MQDSSSRVRLEPETEPYRALDDGGLEEESHIEEMERAYRLQVRRGVARGAAAGFVVGLMPLMTMTLLGAIAGAMISRASRLRIQKVSGPRIQFVRRTNNQAPR